MVFKGITPDKLVDPHHPPPEADGPYIIDGQNRSFDINLLYVVSRLVICREIISNNEHQNLDLFRPFECEIYCFPNPRDPDQVDYYFLILSSLGKSHPLSWCNCQFGTRFGDRSGAMGNATDGEVFLNFYITYT